MIAFQRSHCMPPSVRQIQVAFGFRHPNAVTSHLNGLVKKGMVMHTGPSGKSRAYLAVFRDQRCPCCGRLPMGRSPYAREVEADDPAHGLSLAHLEPPRPGPAGYAGLPALNTQAAIEEHARAQE
jgi:hypothetical protein